MGGHFSWLTSFEGLQGGPPEKNINFLFIKNCHITISFKSEKKKNVLYAKYRTIIISARGGGLYCPPPPD